MKKGKNRRDISVSISMSKKLKKQLETTSAIYGLSVSDYIRALLFENFKSPHHHHYQYILTVEGSERVTLHVSQKEFEYLEYIRRSRGPISPIIRKLICGRSV